MTKRFAVIIPALDEEEAIGATLEGLSEALLGGDFAGCHLAQVIVVDNGSSDGTAAAARAHSAGLPLLVIAEPRRGYGQACLTGIAALEAGAEIVAFLDADGSDHPADLARLLEPLVRDESDLVLGSRELGEHEPGSLSPQQRWGNWLATRLLRLFFGARYTDLGPFRAIRSDVLERLAMRDTNFGWTIEMQIKAARTGLRVQEIPVRYRRRRAGKSKVGGSIRGSILAGVKILSTILRLRFSA